MARVLIVEDEASLARTIAYNLRRQGYDVETAADGERALDLANATRPDMVVLDLMLPGMDGFDVCRQIRRTSAVPVLMLTARDDEIDRVVGLEIGADDYMTKPFSMRELIARVKAMLRRRELLQEEIRHADAPSRDMIEAGELTLSRATRQVTLRDQPLRLKPREFDLLEFLMRNRERVYSAEQLLEHVWGDAFTRDTRTVPVHIRGIRRKIEDDPSNPTRIETVRGVGYRFVG
ncbi:MAG: response regulator transcription factor [Chloroflexi bacterium]|nr:response regulator transcription factor [Chloroflexota bacterium]